MFNCCNKYRCIKKATYSFNGYTPEYCFFHKLNNMIKQNNNCIYNCCKKKAKYNSNNNNIALYCAEHRYQNMILIK